MLISLGMFFKIVPISKIQNVFKHVKAVSGLGLMRGVELLEPLSLLEVCFFFDGSHLIQNRYDYAPNCVYGQTTNFVFS